MVKRMVQMGIAGGSRKGCESMYRQDRMVPQSGRQGGGLIKLVAASGDEWGPRGRTKTGGRAAVRIHTAVLVRGGRVRVGVCL